jgi:hypothetical protein
LKTLQNHFLSEGELVAIMKKPSRRMALVRLLATRVLCCRKPLCIY